MIEYSWYYYFSSFRLKGIITNNNVLRKDPGKVAISKEAMSARVVDMLLNKALHPAPSL